MQPGPVCMGKRRAGADTVVAAALEVVQADPYTDAAAGVVGALQQTGILLKPGSTDRHARVQRVKQALATAPDGFPWWQITAACPNLLRTLPELPHDPDDPEDVDTDAEDHAYDSVGLFWQARPELPKPREVFQTYYDLDPLSRDHALALQKRYDQKRKPGVLNLKGFILG